MKIQNGWLIIGLLAVICIATPSCQKEPKREVSNNLKELRVYLTAEPTSLDPRIGGERRSQMIQRELFEGLTRIGIDGKPHPAVAKMIEVSPDGLTYTFTLGNSLWSSGDPVTAHDFEYAWKSILDPKFPSAFSYAFTFIKGARDAKTGKIPLEEVGIHAVDDQTLVVELAHPAPYFLEMAANPLYSPVSKKTSLAHPDWAKNGGASFVCNGPFILDTWKHQQEIKLKKNPSYYQADSVKIDIISAPIIEDPQTALNMYEKGDIDWVGEPFGNLPLEAIPSLKSKNLLTTQEIGGLFWYEMNTTHPMFKSQKIRKAFATALNRQDLTQHLLQGGERPAFTIVPEVISSLNTPTFEDNNVVEAKRLFEEGLKEIGMTREQMPVLVLSHWQEPREKAIASTVQQQWQQALGVTIRLTSADWTTYLKKVSSGDFDIANLNWYSWYLDPVYNMESIKFKTSGMNGTQWENALYISLLDQADQEVDIEKRLALLAQAEQLVMEELPLIPVYYHAYKYVKKPYVSGEYLSPVGQLELKDVVISK